MADAKQRPTVMIDPSEQDPSTVPADPEQPFPDRCPKCGDGTIWGMGLAGGGFGSYVTCKSCDFMSKVLADEEEED